MTELICSKSQAKALDLYQHAEIKTAVEDLSWHVGFMRSLWEAVLVLRAVIHTDCLSLALGAKLHLRFFVFISPAGLHIWP